MEQLRPASADAGDAELGKRRIERRRPTIASRRANDGGSLGKHCECKPGHTDGTTDGTVLLKAPPVFLDTD